MRNNQVLKTHTFSKSFGKTLILLCSTLQTISPPSQRQACCATFVKGSTSDDRFFYFFMESSPLTKAAQQAQLAACRKKWLGVFYFLTSIKHNLYISIKVSRSALFSALGEGEIGTSISIFLVLCRNPPSNILCRFLTGYSRVLPSL